MKFPKIKENQFVVVMADGLTGILLNTDLKTYDKNSNSETCLVFETLELAIAFTEKIASVNNKVEFVIYDNKQEVIRYIEAKL